MERSNRKAPYQYTRQTLKVYWRHSMRYKWRVAWIAFGVLAYTVAQTAMPLFYRNLINALATGISPAVFKVGVNVIIMILIVNAVRLAIWRSAIFVNSYFQAKVMNDLMNTCYQYMNHHSYGFFTSRFVGSLVTKVKRFERSFETIADQITFNLGRSLFDTAVIISVLLWQYHTIGFVILAWALIFVAFSYGFALYKLPLDIKRADADTETTAQLADSITNNINIKLFTSFATEEKRYATVTNKQFLLRKKSWRLGNLGDLVQNILAVGLEFGVVYYALHLWLIGVFQVGDVVLVITYLMRIFDKLWDTGNNVRQIYEALADANEMTEMLIQPHEVNDAPDAAILRPEGGRVQFKDVSFGYYRETPVLNHFNLDISSGERLALIGPSGGGKSTIVKALFRLFDIQSGEILIDGQSIAKVTQNSLREVLSLVPQEPILFHRSLMENIRYARPEATDEEVINAAKLAHAHEFIKSFREGYATLVGERGIKLSGGERQRVAIARAILKDSPILVLDEATSSLDSESEMFIQDALRRLMQNRTTIVVAHRLSTIMQMDRIVVIGDGKIIEEGKHEELLKLHEGLYQKLWGIQAGGFAAVAEAG